MVSKRVLIVGCGYVGLPLGQELARQGHKVFGLRRTASAAQELHRAQIEPLSADITKPETLTALPGNFDWVVNCAATGGGTVEDYCQLYTVGNTNLIEWLRAAPPQKFVYTSSTGVYGQDDGSLVVETDPVTPAAETAKVLVETENLLLRAYERSNFPAVILRLAGIYGPGRGYWLKQFVRGEARLDGDGSRYLNMIHLEDVVRAIVTSLERAPIGAVYNVVDHEPVMQRDLFAWLAAQLNRPGPASAATAAEANRKRGATNKRVSNLRLRQELGFNCQHPTFREGFMAELARMRQNGELSTA